MAATSTPSSPADAVAYLRGLIERQPACLVRVRLDGVLLACNDAGLGLFGVGRRGAVLQTNLVDRLASAERARWPEFAARAWANGAASFETHLIVDEGVRPLLVHGIALADHPDGVDSLLLHLRDQSQTHRLEDAIRSAEIARAAQEERERSARDQAEQAVIERTQLAALADQHLAGHEAERQRLTEALDAQVADRHRREAKFVELERSLEESQLALLANEREHRGRVSMLEGALAALHEAQAFSAAARDKQDAEREQEQAAAAERHRHEVAELQLRLQTSTGEVARLGTLLAEQEDARRQSAATHRAAVEALELALARARDEAVHGRNEARETRETLEAQLSAASAEQGRLAARIDEHERGRNRLIAEHQQAVADLERVHRDALAGLHAQLTKTAAEHRALVAKIEDQERERQRLVDENDGERRRLLAEHEAERRRLVEEREAERQQLLAEHQRTLADLEAGKRDAVAPLQAQLALTTSEQRAAAARLEAYDRERERMAAEHSQALADLEASRRVERVLQAQLAQMTGERTALAARVEEQERERTRASAEHHQALAAAENAKREALAALRAQLSQMAAEQTTLAARVEAVERERERVTADGHQAMADLEASKQEALGTLQARLAQVTADHRDAMATLHAQLTQTSSRQAQLVARIAQHEQERVRMTEEHRRAMADLQASKREAIAECERVLTAIHQKLADQDETSAHIERCILEVLGEAARRKAALTEVAEVPPARAPIVSTTKTAPGDEAPLHGVFDAADETFVRQLIGEADEPEAKRTGREDPVFDAEDDDFVRRLIAQNRDGARKDADDTQEDS